MDSIAFEPPVTKVHVPIGHQWVAFRRSSHIRQFADVSWRRGAALGFRCECTAAGGPSSGYLCRTRQTIITNWIGKTSELSFPVPYDPMYADCDRGCISVWALLPSMIWLNPIALVKRKKNNKRNSAMKNVSYRPCCVSFRPKIIVFSSTDLEIEYRKKPLNSCE